MRGFAGASGSSFTGCLARDHSAKCDQWLECSSELQGQAKAGAELSLNKCFPAV